MSVIPSDEEDTLGAVTGFFCSCCGEWHEGLPMDIAFDGPEPRLVASAEADGVPIEQSSEWYVIGDTGFIRAILTIPVVDAPADEADGFCWGVWVMVSGQDFRRIVIDTRETGMPEDEPMIEGYLGNQIPGYPNTLFMDVEIDARSMTQRPSVYVKHSDHPLTIEQQQGIAMARVQEINEYLLHGE